MPEIGGNPIKVTLFSDEPVTLAGFRALIADTPDIQLSSAGCNINEFGEVVRQNGADVALVDAPPQMDQASILEIGRHTATCRIVLWVQSVTVQLAYDLREAGVAGILRKQLPAELMIRCLRKVAQGETWFERELMNSLLEARQVRLSPREQQLMDLVCRGCSNKQVAGALSISEGTVKVYFSKLFHKLGVSDRFELALFGLQNRRLDDIRVEQQRPRSVLVQRQAARR